MKLYSNDFSIGLTLMHIFLLVDFDFGVVDPVLSGECPVMALPWRLASNF